MDSTDKITSQEPAKRRPDLAAARKAARKYKSATARGQRKRDAVLDWIFLWGKSTPGLIKRLLNIQADGYCAQLKKKGLLAYHTTTHVRGGKLVMLTADGLTRVHPRFPDLIGTYDLRYGSFSPDRLVHDLSVQAAVMSIMQSQKASGEPIVKLRPERIIGTKDHAGGKRPDCLMWPAKPKPEGEAEDEPEDDLLIDSEIEPDDLPIALEIERSPKRKGRELQMTMTAAARAVENGKVAEFVYIALNEIVLDTYRETLEQPLPCWTFDEKAKRWIAPGKPYEVPEDVQAAFIWHHMPKLAKPFLP